MPKKSEKRPDFTDDDLRVADEMMDVETEVHAIEGDNVIDLPQNEAVDALGHDLRIAASGLAASMQPLALLIGPLGGGFVSGLAGNPAVYFTIGVMLMLTAIPAYLLIREPDMFTVRERPAPVSSH